MDSTSPLSLRKVAAIQIEDHGDMSGAFGTACELLPGLIPSTLPRLVVIKPNLCDIASWETGVTTDPRWLSVLAAKLRAIRPDAKILVVESDAISAYKTYRSCDETFERLGFVEAAKNAGVELVNLSKANPIELQLPCIPYPVRIPELFLEEMYFISIANLKLHVYTRMTGILKNSVGLLTDADVSSLHPFLSPLIAGLHALMPPDLCIIDGRIGLEGQGPIIGDPVRANCLLVGQDALAVDEAACRFMGISPDEVAHVCETARRMRRRLGQIEVIGDAHLRPFHFSALETHLAIQRKFANRRFHQRLESFTARWLARAFLLKQSPFTYLRVAVPKLARRMGGK